LFLDVVMNTIRITLRRFWYKNVLVIEKFHWLSVQLLHSENTHFEGRENMLETVNI